MAAVVSFILDCWCHRWQFPIWQRAATFGSCSLQICGFGLSHRDKKKEREKDLLTQVEECFFPFLISLRDLRNVATASFPLLCGSIPSLHKTQTKTRRISGPSRNPRHSWIYVQQHQSGRTVVGIPEHLVSRHTWNHIYQPSVKTIITFRFLRASSTLSLSDTSSKTSLINIQMPLECLSGRHQQAAHHRPGQPSHAEPVQSSSLRNGLMKAPFGLRGPAALLTGHHADLCSADTSRCESGFVGHKCNADPLILESHFRVKPKRRIYFRMNVLHPHGAKIIDLQQNRPELKIPAQHTLDELELHVPVQLNEHEQVEAGEFHDASLTNVLRQRHWWSVCFHSPSDQQLIPEN